MYQLHNIANDGIFLFLGPFLKTLWISIGYIIYWVNFHMSDNSINKKNHCPITNYVIVMEFAWI